MRGNRRRDTAPELALRSALHRRGLRFRVDQPLPFDRRRRADITFPRRRVAVFVDGCFWHGCPQHYVAPRTHSDYWAAKIAGNRARDVQTTQRLQDEGWMVLRFWEHEDVADMTATVCAAVASRAEPVRGEPPSPGQQGEAYPLPGPRELGRLLRWPLSVAERLGRHLRG